MTHICVSKFTIIALDNGLSPGRRQAIIWTSAGILLIGPLGSNFSKISIEFITFFTQENALEIVVCEMAAMLSRPQCVKIIFLDLFIISLTNFYTSVTLSTCRQNGLAMTFMFGIRVWLNMDHLEIDVRPHYPLWTNMFVLIISLKQLLFFFTFNSSQTKFYFPYK